MVAIKKELKKNKKMVFQTLRYIIKCYESEKGILNRNKRNAVKRTLETYEDFYEWLQGKI